MAVVSVGVAEEVTDELVEAIARLVPQLSGSAPSPDRAQLEELVGTACTRLLVARADGGPEGGGVVGTLTLVMFRIPTGVRAWIEDVVVDGDWRGRGVGEALTAEALAIAEAGGARSVDLTSRPSREAANRLYRRLGFEARDTNVMRRELPRRPPPCIA